MSAQIMLARTPEERRRVLAFVRRHVRRLYGGAAPRPSQILFFAEAHRMICGTIALDFADKEGKLPLESIYRIDYALTPWPFERGTIAQFCKWSVTRPGVAVQLMHAAHVHALSEGKRVGLAEAKPRIVARVKEFGMSLVGVPGAVQELSGGSSRGERYYSIPPPPRLYMFDIPSNALALGGYIELHEKV